MARRLTRFGLESTNEPEAKQARLAHTARGTIESIQHPGGVTITPTYNKVGIIIGLEFCDGTKVVRSNAPGPLEFFVVDAEGNKAPDIQIKGLTIDRKGNIICTTGDNEKFTIFADGSTNLL